VGGWVKGAMGAIEGLRGRGSTSWNCATL